MYPLGAVKGLLILIALAACSSGGRPLPPALVASNGSAGLAVQVPRALPPAASPGERMSYKVSIHGLEVAEFTISVGDVATLDGVDVVVVQSTVRSTKVAAWIRKMQDDFTSWIDTRTGRSVAFTASEVASSKDKATEQTTARFTADGIDILVERSDREPQQEHQTLDGSGGYDFTSFLMYMRSWEGEPGARVQADIMRSRYVWRNQLVVVGYENLVTALGELPVVRIDGEGVRIRRDGTVDPDSDRRRWSIWITDDADRVPVRLVAHTDYGDVEMALVSYRPATVARW